MISIRDEDKTRLEEIVTLLDVGTTPTQPQIDRARTHAIRILSNIIELMRPAKIGY